MKNLKYLIFTLLLMYMFGTMNTYASSLSGSWATRINYGDGTSYPGTVFSLWGHNFRSTLTQDTITWFYNAHSPLGFDVKTVVQSSDLYTGAIVKAEVYILTNYNLSVGKKKYYTTFDAENDYVQISKIADNIPFRGESFTGTVYKLTYSFKNQDCLDSEFGSVYICYGDTYIRTFAFGSIAPTDGFYYAAQLYGYGDVIFSELKSTQPGESIEKESFLTTVINLPGRLLSWFSELPGNIWNGLKTGFNWVVDCLLDIGGFILNLPSNIWNFMKSGFNWITDSIGNLFNFFSNDDDPDLSLLNQTPGIQSNGWLPVGPVDSILNLPLTYLNNLNANLTKNCNTVNVPLPFVNKTLPLPCLNSIYSSINGLSTWINSIAVLLSALILFKYLINLYRWVDKTLSLKDNDYLSNWGGV